MMKHYLSLTEHKMKRFSSAILIRIASAVCLAGAMVLAGGCGNSAPKLSTEQNKTFDSAPTEVKQTWDKALAADKANDYVTAAAALDSLKAMILSDAQKQALNVERDAFNSRLMKAVDKNDPAAIQAVQNSQKAKNSR